MESIQQNTELQKFNITDAWIEEAKKQYMPLKVSGIEDKEGYQAVREARLIIKRKRVEVEKVAKDLNEDALKWQRTVNSEKKRIIELLAPIEKHLQFEEDKIEIEKERIRKAEEQKLVDRLNNRVSSLISAGCVFDGVSYNIGQLTIDNPRLKMIEDEAFESFLSSVKDQKAKDDEQKAEQERQRMAEEERLRIEREALEKSKREQEEREAAFRAEQDRIKREQDEREAAIKAEQDRIEREARAKREAEERERAIKEAAEKARQKAIEDAKREEEEKRMNEAAAAAEAARLEALRPDKEKLARYAEAGLQAAIDAMPEVSNEQAAVILADARMLIGKIRNHIISKLNTL